MLVSLRQGLFHPPYQHPSHHHCCHHHRSHHHHCSHHDDDHDQAAAQNWQSGLGLTEEEWEEEWSSVLRLASAEPRLVLMKMMKII